MFPMNDTLRKNLHTQTEMAQAFSGQVMDWQATVALNSQKQFNAMFDSVRTLLDANHKAARAMQQTVLDTFAATEEAA